MRKILYVLLLAGLINIPVICQYGSVGAADARSSGLAKTYNAINSGVLAIGINPANLINSKTGSINFSTWIPFPSISARTGTNFMTLADFNYYFGGVNGKSRILNSEDKTELNDLLKNGGLIFGNASSRLFSFTYNNKYAGVFGFSITDFLGTSLKFPKSIVDLAFNGNEIGKTYDLDQVDVKGWWIRDYSLSYAHSLSLFKSIFNNFGFGITGKLVTGFSYIGSERVNTYLNTADDYTIKGNADLLGYSSFSNDLGVNYDFDKIKRDYRFTVFPDPAGIGYGFDLGFSASVNNVLNLGVAVTDIGMIKWYKNAAQFSSFGKIYLDDITNKDQIDSLQNKITGTSKQISDFKTGLPTAFRFGVSYLFNRKYDRIPGTLLLAFDFNLGFNDLPGNSKNPRYSIGAEWKPLNWLPYFRTGISYGGLTGLSWAFGLGVDFGLIELHLATSDMQSLIVPNNTKQISVSIGSSWKIN